MKKRDNYKKIHRKHLLRMMKKHHYGEYLGFGGYLSPFEDDFDGLMFQQEKDLVIGKLKFIVTG